METPSTNNKVSIGNKRKSPVFSLKVSEKEKYENDCEWFKNYMLYVIPSESAIVEDYDLMKMSYEVANNNLEGFRDKIKQFCAPLGEDIGQIEEEVIPYPELYNKINVLKGEMLKRGDNFKIVLLTAKAIKDKNMELYEAIKASVDEKLGIILEAQKQQMAGMNEQEVQEYIQKLRTQEEPDDILNKNWQSELEIFYSKALKYAYFDQDIKQKKLETFEDVVVSDRCFIYSGWKSGKPYLEIRNPLFCGFHKNPNEPYVHKGDYFWYRKAITPADVFNNYDLTDEELGRLGLNTYTAAVVDRRHAVGRTAKPVYDHVAQELMMATDNAVIHNKTVGAHQSTSQVIRRQSDLVWETHFEFKAFKELIFLSYTDEYNEEVVVVMPPSFSSNIPKDATKEEFINRYGTKSTRYVWFDKLIGVEYRAESIWIPRKYEIVRLGNDVFPICREVPHQYTNVEDPFSNFGLSTKGAVFTSRNAKSVSILQRALAPYFQYIYVKHIQNRELSKYLGSTLDMDVDQIPDDLGKDYFGNDIRDKFLTWFVYLKKTGINFYSGSQTSLGGLPPATRSPGSKANNFENAMHLFNLQQLLEMIKREIGMAMGISPQREGSFEQRSNVSDNQQAIIQSYSITEPYFFLHNQVWKEAINDWLINFRTYCDKIFKANPRLKDHSFNYILPNGTEELLKVTPKSLTHTSVGLYISDSGQEQRYMDAMLNFSQAFAQNAGEGMSNISNLIKLITTGSSPEEVHKAILMQEQKQHERQMELQKAQAEQEQKNIELQMQAREDVQAHEIEKIRVKAEEDRTTDIMTETIRAQSWAEDKDVDKDGKPDVLEIADHFLNEKKINLDIEKFEHQKEVDKEKLKIERKKASQPKSVKK